MSKKKKPSEKEGFATQNEKYVTVPFDKITPASFFYSNGFLCIKMDDKRYLQIDPNRDRTIVVEWDKNDFKLAHICDTEYRYQLNIKKEK